jgi:hypothetical protein
MQINFDTSTVQPSEVRGLIALLETLLPVNSKIHLAPQNPSLASEESPNFGTPIVSTLVQPELLFDAPSATELAADPGPAAADPGPAAADPGPAAGQPTTRARRRTKAEMEAAAKSQAAPADPTLGCTVPIAAVSVTTQSATASPATAPALAIKPVSADELRSLLNGYIARHSIEEAIDKLKAFGCNRVTEAIALEPTKLSELAAVLNG